MNIETLKEMAYNIGFRSAHNFEFKPFAANSEAMALADKKICKIIVLIEQYNKGYFDAINENNRGI